MALNLAVEVTPESKATLVAIASLGDDLKLGLLDALRDSATEIRSAALAKVRGGGSGRSYRGHRASAPGQPPASDTGGLARTIKQKIFAKDLKAAVYTGVPLGFWLESGTLKRKTRTGTPNPMRPRPWLVPARDEHADAFVARVSAALDGLVDKFESGAP